LLAPVSINAGYRNAVSTICMAGATRRATFSAERSARDLGTSSPKTTTRNPIDTTIMHSESHPLDSLTQEMPDSEREGTRCCQPRMAPRPDERTRENTMAIWTVARKRSGSSWKPRTRAALCSPSSARARIRLLRLERTATSLAEKNPTIAIRRRTPRISIQRVSIRPAFGRERCYSL
jgi:hypothetical protein